MRRLMIFLGVLALLWCGWWAVGTTVAERSIRAWLDMRRAEGWKVQATVERGGFPLELATRLSDVSLSDPATGAGFAAKRLDVSAAAYWPGYMTVDLPGTPIRLSYLGHTFNLSANDAHAKLDLSPGIALEVNRAVSSAAKWMLSSDGQALANGNSLMLGLLQDEGEDARYRFEFSAQGVTPGGPIRAALELPNEWPMTFDSAIARMTIDFDRPLDRTARQGTPPQPRHVALSALDLAWGDFRLTGSGDVDIAADGTPTGDIMLQIDNWQNTLDIASQSGLLPKNMQTQAQMMLGGLANMGGGGEDLQISLVFANGDMSLGPIRLGPAPKFVIE